MIELEKPLFSKADLQRIQTQATYEEIYLSTHIWNKVVTNEGGEKDIDPLIPIAATISEISSDLIFGEFPALNFNNDQTQSQVATFLKERAAIGHDFKIELLESSVYSSALGMVFWYVFVEDGKAYWKFRKPQNATWDSDYFGLTDVKFYDLIDDTEKSKTYEVEEFTREGDVVQNNFYEVIVDKATLVVKKITTISESTVENLDVIPVIPVYNSKYMDETLGKSDYEGKQQLFAEIDNRVDQINSVLQDHSDPWTFIPAGILNEFGQFQRSQGKMVEKSMAASNVDNTVEFSTWDASLSAAFQQIDLMIRLAYGTSRIAPSLSPFADLSGGNAESGRSLKHRSVTTVSMINRKRVYWEQSMKAFFAIVQKVDSGMKNIQLDDFKIEWADGLPTDDQELTDLTIQKVHAGIISKVTANEQLEGSTPQDAQTEVDSASKEKTEEAAVASAATGPITF